MGSVHYFSPEQAKGEGANATSDLYSTGVVLYEMLTGRVPYDGDNPVAVAMQHLHATPIPIQNLAPDVPPALVRVCMKAMEKNPVMRYQTARDMAADIRAALENRPERPAYPEKELEIQQPKPQMVKEETGPKYALHDTGRTRDETVSRRKIKTIILTTALGLALATGLFFGVRAIFNQIVTTATVPYVNGLDVKDAEALLEQEGLKYEEMYFNTDDVKVNVVMVQKPEADTVVRKGDTVMLSVSSGPSQLQMPDVQGMTMDEATTLLKSYGLIPTCERVINGDYPIDTVVSQTPSAYEKVNKDTPVTISISGGKTTVPLVRNLSLSEAEELLKQNQLKINPVLTYVDTRNAKEHGKITSQSPAENLDVMLDSEISLNVYRYPTDRADYTFDVVLKKTDEDISLRVTLKAEGSDVELEGYSHTYNADMDRKQPVTVNLPDNRHYICTVYQNGEPMTPFEIPDI